MTERPMRVSGQAPSGQVSVEDMSFLDRAVQLGRRGWGRVSPNPMVGCVVVQGGEVVGEGWHRELGGPHAEVHALAEAGPRARGATVYTSLEPCAHTGRTPPCTRALSAAGVARVVFGAADPGTGAGGAAVLSAAGLCVDGPAFSRSRAAAYNPAFFHVARTRTPYLALKLALSLDGRISRAGEQTALTGPPAREHVHYLRAGFDAILVGANTMEIDDPRLTVRGPLKPRRAPDRIVLDSRARLSPEARLLREDEGGRVRIFTGPDAPESRVRAVRGRGATVHTVPCSTHAVLGSRTHTMSHPASGGRRRDCGVSLASAAARTQASAAADDSAVGPRAQQPARAGRLDLGEVLDICYQEGLTSLLCEGGGVLASSLLGAGHVQRLYLYFAPRTLGPGSVAAFPGCLDDPVWEGWRPARPPAVLGRDILWELDRDG